MGHRKDVPPTDWPGMELAGLTKLTDEIYFGWLASDPNPVFWHWCTTTAALPEELTVSGGWRCANTADHTLVSPDPLHLEPSLLWQCCGLHGWVRNGQWTTA